MTIVLLRQCPGGAADWVLGGAGVVAAGAVCVGTAGVVVTALVTGAVTFVRGRIPLTSPYSRFIVKTRVTASSSRAREIAPDCTAFRSARNAASCPRFVPEM